MYHRHLIGTLPESGEGFATRDEALAGLPAGHKVTFVATRDQRNLWQLRELGRFSDGTYQHVPWITTPTVVVQDGVASVLAIPTVQHHYAHLSTGNPGLIAYTPDDAFGVEDRQLRVKPGKYLTQFFGGVYTAEEIVAWSDAVKAASVDMHFAHTPSECVSVYTSLHGPDSCMSGRGRWTTETHPAQVYGGGDTAVAYLGHIGGGAENHTVSARAVVRTDTKQFSRAYGTAAGVLVTLLLAAGYEQSHTALHGARVRAVLAVPRSGVTVPSWIMPYIDGVASGTLQAGSEFFLLSRGPVEAACKAASVQNLDGVTWLS